MKKMIISILCVIVSAILGTVLLIAVYLIPLDNIRDNVKDSALVFKKEGTYPTVFSWCTSQLDNFTDALMMLGAADDTKTSVVDRAMKVYRGTIDSKNPCETLISSYLYESSFTGVKAYSRYWHGYLVLLKPILSIMSYKTIRKWNLLSQLLLILVVFRLMAKRNLKMYILPVAISYMMLTPTIIGLSLQFSDCYYIASIGMIMLLALNDEKRSDYAYLIFLLLGVFTAYFDFLTYPLVTYGLPAIIMVGGV